MEPYSPIPPEILRCVRIPEGILSLFSGLRFAAVIANSIAVMRVSIRSRGLGSVVLEALSRFTVIQFLQGDSGLEAPWYTGMDQRRNHSRSTGPSCPQRGSTGADNPMHLVENNVPEGVHPKRSIEWGTRGERLVSQLTTIGSTCRTRSATSTATF